MRIRLTSVHLLWLSLVMGGELQAAAPTGSCDSYTWNVSKERALFAGTPRVVVARTEMKGAPRLLLGQLYELHLSPSPQVGRLPGDAPRPVKYAGLASVQIATSGTYHIALDNDAWVGTVSGITANIPKGFQGAVACTAPRKLVDFDLSAGQIYTVQISVSPTATMRLSITPAATAKP
jgi:hypothetical protein